MRLSKFGIAAVALVVTLEAAAGPAQAADLIPFKIGISAPVVTVFPVLDRGGGRLLRKGGT
jgi:hypothetical protein